MMIGNSSSSIFSTISCLSINNNSSSIIQRIRYYNNHGSLLLRRCCCYCNDKQIQLSLQQQQRNVDMLLLRKKIVIRQQPLIFSYRIKNHRYSTTSLSLLKSSDTKITTTIFRKEPTYSIQPNMTVPIYIGGIPTLPSSMVDANNDLATTSAITSNVASLLSSVLPVYDKYSGKQFCAVTATNTTMMEQATHITSTIGTKRMRELLPYERKEILYNIAQQVRKRKEEMAYYITIESGKTITDARNEVERCIQTFMIASDATIRINDGTYTDYQYAARTKGYTAIMKRFPLNGPIVCITPFNFPLNLVAHKIAPAIAVGCAFVIKPSDRTPLSAIVLGEILHTDPIMPNEGFSIVPCHRHNSDSIDNDYRIVGDALITDERYKLISFTGSANVGFHHIKRLSGKKPVLLELGGNAYCIMNDIDHIVNFDSMIHDIMMGAFYQSGQSCISIQHLLVHDTLYDDVVHALIHKVQSVLSSIGNPHDDTTMIGPLIDNESVVRIESWIQDAVQQGATILCGTGKRWISDHHQNNNNFIQPTILVNVPHDCKLSSEEVFGPILCIERYTNFYDAIHRVNTSKYGLQTGIYTNQNDYIQHAYNTIDCGTVCINIPPSTRIDAQPYGGTKDSGIGREGIQYIMEHHYTECKVLMMKN